MKKLFRLIICISVIAVILSIAACDTKGTAENKYGIKNYSIVYSRNGTSEYQNYGAGTNEQTVFELGSNGKTVAAYVALRMVDEGILDLDTKIYQYLDSKLLTNDPRLKDITLEQLLCHTAGFSPSYELGVDKKIYSDPGDEFRYSGVGYIYLQSVIENASGMTMDQAASKYVFVPLGVKNSTFESERTVTPYMRSGNAVLYSMLVFAVSFVLLLAVISIIGKITKQSFFSFKTGFAVSFIAAGIINSVFLLFFFVSKVFVLFLILYTLMGAVLLITRKKSKLFYIGVSVIMILFFAAGFALPLSVPVTNDLIHKDANCAYSFKSTAEDMALFCDELMTRSKESDGSLNKMFMPAVVIDENNSWGLGIAVESNEEDGTTYWHSGINPGFQSLYVLYPQENKYILVLTNSDNGLDFAIETARAFLGVDGVWQIKR